ncbi:MAG: polyphosphate polymerase domain-containing protein [Christensenellaceae bacterium]|jgi:hypothetical protein
MQGRHEYKHSLNFMDYTILKSRLSATLSRDRNVNEKGEYAIRSLYFDTPGDKALREKIDGVDRREKFRIRRYSSDATLLRIEKKAKLRGRCYKSDVVVTKEEVNAILAGEIAFMASDSRPLLTELYSKMRGQLLQPKTIVDYIREPFIYPAGNVRITLDRDIRTGLFSQNFFCDTLPTIPVGDEIVLLEVKYDAFLPDFVIKLLQLGNRRAAACSKYALSRMYD